MVIIYKFKVVVSVKKYQAIRIFNLGRNKLSVNRAMNMCWKLISVLKRKRISIMMVLKRSLFVFKELIEYKLKILAISLRKYA